jgi:hypothetical protein
MKRIYLTIIGVAFWFGSGYGNVEGFAGKVIDATTLLPIEGAKIIASTSPDTSDPRGYTFTSSSGRYELDIQRGTYYAWAKKEGYYTQRYPNTVLVRPWDVTEGIDFSLLPIGSDTVRGRITGRVIDETTGIPIVGAEIRVFLRCDAPLIASTISDSAGNYSVEVAGAGVDSVAFFLFCHAPYYIEEWWNNRTSCTSATPVYVKENGEIIRGIDFALSKNPPGWVAGKVIDENTNLPIKGARINLHLHYTLPPIATTLSDSAGNYVAELPFAYDSVSTVCFVFCFKSPYRGEWWDDKTSPHSADRVVVRRGEVTRGINFILEKETSETGVVMGIVKDAETSLPIGGALVEIVPESGGPDTSFHAYTDEAGKYLITGVLVGTYIGKASKVGYFSAVANFQVFANETTVVNYTLGKDTTSIWGSISGRVLLNADSLLPRFVFIYPEDDDNSIARTEADMATGEYKVKDIPPGNYHAVAYAYGYSHEWYEEASERRNATVIVVQRGRETENINFTLEKLPPGWISGIVHDTSGLSIAGALVYAQGIGNWIYEETFTDATGAYIMELSGGVYNVGAYAEGYLPGTYPNFVSVIPGDTTSYIDIELEPVESQAGSISGKVVDDSTQSPIPFALVIAITDVSSSLPFFGYAFTDSSGNYKIEEVPVVSEEIFYLIAFAQGYIPEFYDGVYSWEDATPVGSNATGIDFELGRARIGARGISGVIKEEEREEVIADVVIYAMDGDKVVGATRSLNDGTYLLKKLPPGTYTLKFTKPGYKDVTYGPVSVVTEDVGGIDVKLSRPPAVEEGKPHTKKGLELLIFPSIVSEDARLSYYVPKDTRVELSLYDISGRKVLTLLNNKVSAGDHYAILNTRTLAQGLYFVKLVTPRAKVVEKLILLR